MKSQNDYLKEFIFYVFWFLSTFTGCEIAKVFVELTDLKFGGSFQLLIEEDRHPGTVQTS